jgi:hypothetical protein
MSSGSGTTRLFEHKRAAAARPVADVGGALASARVLTTQRIAAPGA